MFRTSDAQATYYPVMPTTPITSLDGEAAANRWRDLGYWATGLRVNGAILVCVRCATGGYRYPERIPLDAGFLA